MCVREGERERMSVCERKRVHVRVCVRGREWVHVRERAGVCVFTISLLCTQTYTLKYTCNINETGTCKCCK